MKISFLFRFVTTVTFLIWLLPASRAQIPCKFSDDFSSPAGWTQVGDLVTIQNGAVEYLNGAPDSEQRRVYKNIGTSLGAADAWTADIDFTPVSVGDYNGPHAGHIIAALTAGIQESFSNCPDVPCSGYPPSVQDAVICMFGSPGNPSDGNSYFMIKAVEGSDAGEYTSIPIQANALGATYFVRLQRLSSTLISLSVFTDAARTIHQPGSPSTLAIPSSIENLTTVQHGNIARGGPYRELTGHVDNLCIRWSKGLCPPDRTLSAVTGSTININTGVDENLNLLPFGMPDPRWSIAGNTLPPMRALDRWNFIAPTSEWIGFDDNQGSIETNYQVHFTFCTEDCGDYRLNFRMLADNGACVYVDGVPIPAAWWIDNTTVSDCSNPPNDQSPFIPINGYLIDQVIHLSNGTHTLEIDVVNQSNTLTSINIVGQIEVLSTQDCVCPADRTLGIQNGDEISLNTGVDMNLNLLPFGNIDPRWKIVSNTLPSMKALDRWNFPAASSNWIGFDDNQGTFETNYKVRFAFCLDICAEYHLKFRMMADNGACISIDGTPIYPTWWSTGTVVADCSNPPSDQSPFIPTNGYAVDMLANMTGGIHYLDIDVVNQSGTLSSINIMGSLKVNDNQNCNPVPVKAPVVQIPEVELFPNPAQEIISFKWGNTTLNNLRMTDMLGRTSYPINTVSGEGRVDIPLYDMQPGTYFIFWQDGSGQLFSRCFVKI